MIQQVQLILLQMQVFKNHLMNVSLIQHKIIISQRISSVQNASRIIVLNDGVVDGFDTHENLLETNEIYRTIYRNTNERKGGKIMPY